MSLFKEGDKIRIVNYTKGRNGKTGVITGVKNHYSPVLYKVNLEKPDSIIFLYKEEMELVPQEQKDSPEKSVTINFDQIDAMVKLINSNDHHQQFMVVSFLKQLKETQ